MKTALLVLMLAASASAQTNLIVNGGFEQNAGQNRNIFTGWTVFDQADGSGSWEAQQGPYPPGNYRCKSEAVVPPSGFAAMSTQSEPGSHILYQDVTIPATAASVILSFDFYLLSNVGFSTPPSLDFEVIPNQQFRVDIVDPSAAVQDVGSGVLANVYITRTGDPTNTKAYATQTFDLSQFAGRTIRLRFAEVDNGECFHAGVDNVSIATSGTCPTTPPGVVVASYRGASSNCGATSVPCEAGERINFSPSTTGYAFQGCDSFTWDFGDGTTSTTLAPAHAFGPGVYTVRFTVTNPLGTRTSDGVTVTVARPPRHRAAAH